MESFSPAELARRCQQTLPHDTRAYEEIVRFYKQRVFGTAYRILGDRQDAEDQAQEVFIKVYRNIHRLEDPATLSGWIMQITVNTCRDALDRRARRPQTTPIIVENDDGTEHERQYADTNTPTPEEAADRSEVRRCLEATLAALDPEVRTTLVLRDIEDRPYQEIADALALGLSAVKMRIHRARLSFQQALERLCPETASTVRQSAGRT